MEPNASKPFPANAWPPRFLCGSARCPTHHNTRSVARDVHALRWQENYIYSTHVTTLSLPPPLGCNDKSATSSSNSSTPPAKCEGLLYRPEFQFVCRCKRYPYLLSFSFTGSTCEVKAKRAQGRLHFRKCYLVSHPACLVSPKRCCI